MHWINHGTILWQLNITLPLLSFKNFSDAAQKLITQRCAGSSVDVCASSSSNKQNSPQWWPHTMQRTAPRSYLSLSSHCWPLWRSQGVGTLLCHSSASCVSVGTALSSPLLCCMGSLYSLGRYQTWTGAYQYHLSLFLTHSLSLSLFPTSLSLSLSNPSLMLLNISQQVRWICLLWLTVQKAAMFITHIAPRG